MSESPDRTYRLLSVFIYTRLVVSTVFRMVFPFLPALARGLGVPVEAVAAAVSARSALGLVGPPLGAISDMRGRKQALVGALLLFSLALLAIGIWPAYGVFFIGLVLTGGATVIIDSSIHAYLGDSISYEQRGRATALVELGWSLAFVIGIPLVGMSIARSGWNSPFIWLGVLGLLAAGLIGLFLPRTAPAAGSWLELRSGLRSILALTPLMGLLLAMSMTFANQLISIVFGIWMEDSFGLAVQQVGFASIVIGAAGLLGVACAVLFTDRIGKRLAIGTGLVVNSAVCLVLPLMVDNLWGALAALFIFYLSFEFGLTSLLPLMTALSTQARGVYMAATLACLSLGDALGALVGPALMRNGLALDVLGTVVINICGLIILVAFVKPAFVPVKAQ